MDYPKVGFRLPKAVFTPAQVEEVLLQPDLRGALGLRDRAILETFYSTGLRRMELANLDRAPWRVSMATVRRSQ